MLADNAIGNDNGAGETTLAIGPGIAAGYGNLNIVVSNGDCLLRVLILAANLNLIAHRALFRLKR